MKAFTRLLRAASLCLCVAATSPAFAAINFVGKTTAENNSGPTIDLASPPTGDLQANRFLIAQITFQKGSGVAVTPPAGWSLAKRDNINVQGQDLGQVVYWKRVPNGETAQNYTFNFAPSVKAAATLLLYSGVDTTEPFVGATGNTSATPGATETSMVGLGLDADANSLLVAVYGMKRQTTLTSVPAGMTQRATETNTLPVTTWAYDQSIVAAGATGNRVATVSNPGAIWIAQLLNIRNGEGRANVWDPGTRLEASANSAAVATSVNVTVRVADVDGNAVAGVPVELFVDSADATLGTPAGVTLADGSYTTTLSSTKAGVYAVTAKFDGADEDSSADIAVTNGSPQSVEFYSVGPVDPTHAGTRLEITDAAAIANGADTGAARVSLADQYGNPIRDFAVQFEVNGSADVAAATGVTLPNGTYSTTFVDEVAETVNVRAQVDLDGDDTLDGYLATGDNGAIVFSAGPVASSVFTVVADGAEANGTATNRVSVALEDAFGNPVADVPVAFAQGGVATIVAPGGTTGADGTFATDLTSTVAGVVPVSATYGVNPVSAGSGNVTFVAGPASAATSTITATVPAAPADGTTAGVVTVQVEDANGNPVAGAAVALAKTGVGTLAASSGITDASGSFVASITSADVGAATVTAKFDSNDADADPEVDVTGSAVVTFTAGSVDPTNTLTRIEAVDPVAAADDTDLASVKVVLVDANDNPVAGVYVEFAATGTGVTFAANGGSSNASGEVVATLKSGVAQNVEVTAQYDTNGDDVADTAVGQGSPVEVIFEGDVDRTRDETRIDASAASVVANGTDFGTVTATLVDSNGSPVVGVTVTITGPATATIATPTGKTNVDGQWASQVRSTTAGVADFDAQYDGSGDDVAETAILNGAPAKLTFVAGPADVSNVATRIEATDAIALADGVDTGTARVTVVDANDNPVAGVEVAFALTGSGSLAAANGVTDANGQFATNVTSTVIGNVSVTATVDADDDATDSTEAPVTGSAAITFGEFDTDAAIGKRVTRALTLSNGSGDTVEYEIVVRNDGTTPIFDAEVLDLMPAQLANVTWACTGTAGGACGAANGTGDIQQVVDLPVGSSVTYVVTGFAATVPSAGFLNQAAVDAANDIDPSNDVSGASYQRCAASLQAGPGTTPLAYECVFKDGFENATAN